MTGSERYLLQQVKRGREDYIQALPPLKRRPPLDISTLPLRDAPLRFRKELDQILHRSASLNGEDDNALENLCSPTSTSPSLLGKIVFENVTGIVNPDGMAGDKDFSVGAGTVHAATIVGSSQQGKTSLLNSLLELFGFVYPSEGLVFPKTDLLPTNSKHGTGIPFPIRLEFGRRYELVLQRWDAQRVRDVMSKVAENALSRNPDFFEDLESGFESVALGSFLEFVSEHRDSDSSMIYIPASSAIDSLKADGGVEVVDDFTCGEHANPSMEAHQGVCQFLIDLVESAKWFHYERITLKCPSHLLHYLIAGPERAKTFILDLPGVGIVDDNNSLVEEMVLKDMMEAGTVIILTGERSFTQDIINILKSCVFERLLDPSIVPRPTVAITNSRNLRGLKQNEMCEWREATLNGCLGWNTELQAFAQDMFSGRRHREIQSLEPDLFPNDLEGFIASRQGANEKGVSMLVGYFLRLPEEALIGSVADLLECGRAVMEMVDRLWQADKFTWQDMASCRLRKEAKELLNEEFKRDLDSRLTVTAQKKIFSFVTANSNTTDNAESQMQYIHGLFHDQKCKLLKRFEKVRSGQGDLRIEVPKMIKDSLVTIACQWDENVGTPAFRRFLSNGEEISKLLYQKWAKQLFHGSRRNSEEDKKNEKACELMLSYLSSAVSTAMNDKIKYTLTHALRLHSWNSDLSDITKMLGLRRGRSSSKIYDQVWLSVEDVYAAKEAIFKEQIMDHISLRSDSIRHLIRLMKEVILETFHKCERNFALTMDALKNIATGKSTMSEDPTVILREELGSLVKSIESYLKTHRQMRDRFGAQELNKVLQRPHKT